MTELSPRAFGGGALKGSSLVRFIYLDEAGIAHPQHEPFVVVAGPLVHGDTQWKPLVQRLAAIADKYVPAEHRAGFAFHATELFSGGRVFSRERFDKNVRWAILEELAAIPGELNLPITYGAVRRAGLVSPAIDVPTSELTLRAVGGAYAMCVAQADSWVRDSTVDEIATVVMENNSHARRTIYSAHHFVRDLHAIERPVEVDANGTAVSWASLFGEDATFERVVEDPNFAEKATSAPLQIADACAFIIKRKLMKTPECDRFFDPLSGSIIGGLPIQALF